MKDVHYSRINRTLRRMKNRVFPKSPANIEDLNREFDKEHIKSAFGTTTDDKPFYYGSISNEKSSCAIFGSQEIMDNIEKNIPTQDRVYLMDATFKIVPMGFFTQLLLIYIAYKGSVYPFLYILMSNKDVGTYKELFAYIQANVFNLQPSQFITDFELAMRIALRFHYPGVKMTACWFHYTQCLRRRACKIPNFFRVANADPELDRIFHKFLALALLPANEIKPMFISMKKLVEEKGVPEFLQFVSYFEKQWIKKVSLSVY